MNENATSPVAQESTVKASASSTSSGQEQKEAELKKASRKRRATALDSNWKALQKTLSTPNTISKKRPRVARKTQSTCDRNDIKSEKDGRHASLFMKREAVRSETITRVVALDCEMVGVGPDGKNNALARVSVVNYNGDVLYDTFVKPGEKVTDYRTQWSGVREEDVGPNSKAVDAYDVQKVVGELMRGRIVVGHAIKNDLRVLRIAHPWRDIRDTSDFYKKLWRKRGRRGGRPPALRVLVAQVLGVDSFQKNEHDSCEDARAALMLYKRNEKEWEDELRKSAKRSS